MTKARLRKYRALKRESEWIANRIEVLENMLYSPRMAHLTGMPKAYNPNSGKLESAIDLVMSLRAKYDTRFNRLITEEIEVLTAITDLPYREWEVITAYYIDGKTWQKVAEITHQSLRSVQRLHSAALKRMQAN